MTRKTTHHDATRTTVHELSKLVAVRDIVNRLHVDSTPAQVAVFAVQHVDGWGHRSTRARDLFYFVAACVVRHRLTVAGYHATVHACTRRAGGAS